MKTAPPPPTVRGKKARLREDLKRQGRVLLAFSGGKDSFFLLREACRALGKANVFAYFVTTPFTGGAALDRVVYFQKMLHFRIRRIHVDLFQDARLRRNPKQRCYLCKQRMFAALKKEARRLGIATVADGTTTSDLDEHRPGRRALEKLSIASPLRDAGFSGGEIVRELKRLGVKKAFLAPSTCLATRFPYDLPLDARRISAIGQVEHYLAARGITPLRVRYMADGVRIETSEANFKMMLALKDVLLSFCRAKKLKFVTLDLGGIKSGPWD